MEMCVRLRRVDLQLVLLALWKDSCSLMATEPEIEAVAEAIWTTGGDTLWEHASTGAVIAYRRRARAAIEALDRVRADDVMSVWTCMTCGAIGDRQSCLRCGAESRPGKWVRADDARDTEPDTAKGEETCRRCGGPNRPWAAPSPLWNAVMRGGSIDGSDEFDGIVCPTCFVVLAEDHGIACGWWVEADTVTVELEMVTPSGRVWDQQARRWAEAEAGGTT